MNCIKLQLDMWVLADLRGCERETGCVRSACWEDCVDCLKPNGRGVCEIGVGETGQL